MDGGVTCLESDQSVLVSWLAGSSVGTNVSGLLMESFPCCHICTQRLPVMTADMAGQGI